MNYRMIFGLIGHIMRLEALFMLPGLAISLYGAEAGAIRGFLITIVILMVGSLAPFMFPPRKKAFYAREGFVITGIAWIIVSAFGALPFFISGAIPSYVDSFFEMVSGFTTTGASILTNVEALPKGLLYFRSFSHWLGGMGVLVFLLAIVPMTCGSGESLHILRAESPGPQVGKLVPKMHQTAKILYGIYVVLTLVQIGLMLAGGMPLLDSVCTAFGTAGTGGFGIKNDSMASYSPYLQWVVTIFMAMFGINFNIYYLLLIREFRKAYFNEELRAYLGVMLAATAMITVNVLSRFQGAIEPALRHAAFQVSSIMTTTGFSTTDFNAWPQFSRTILVILMIIGASAGSTGGGMKVSRMLILWKAAKNQMQKLLHPRSVQLVRMDGEIVDQDTVHNVFVFMTVYCAIAISSILLISLDNFPFEANVTAVLSCLNNIGPGLGVVGPMGNFHAFSDFSKLLLSANMLIGRLEIFPMLMLCMPSVWRRSL